MGRPTVFVRGHQETLAALKLIDPELSKQLRKRMNDGARKVLTRAKQRVPARPLRNWGTWNSGKDGRDLLWDPNVVKAGLRFSRASGNIGSASSGALKGRASFRLLNKSPVGAIYEMAGSDGGTGTRTLTNGNKVQWPQSHTFVRNVKANFGTEPRLLIETWRSMKGITMMAAIARECAKAAEDAVKNAPKFGPGF